MKNYLLSVLLFSSFPALSFYSLEDECSIYGGHYTENVHIKDYRVSTILAGKTKYGFVVKVENVWYQTVLGEASVSNSRDEFSRLALAAKVLNLPVNICVDINKYLLGIELR